MFRINVRLSVRVRVMVRKKKNMYEFHEIFCVKPTCVSLK